MPPKTVWCDRNSPYTVKLLLVPLWLGSAAAANQRGGTKSLFFSKLPLMQSENIESSFNHSNSAQAKPSTVIPDGRETSAAVDNNSESQSNPDNAKQGPTAASAMMIAQPLTVAHNSANRRSQSHSMKVIDKINAAQSEGRCFWSFEYFPPKTPQVRTWPHSLSINVINDG
jgi:hypothetical protein